MRKSECAFRNVGMDEKSGLKGRVPLISNVENKYRKYRHRLGKLPKLRIFFYQTCEQQPFRFLRWKTCTSMFQGFDLLFHRLAAYFRPWFHFLYASRSFVGAPLQDLSKRAFFKTCKSIVTQTSKESKEW